MRDPRRPPIVAIGAFFTECNHFTHACLDYDSFAGNEMLRGEALLNHADGSVGGMIAVLKAHGLTPAPLLVTSAVCGGPIRNAAYERIRNELLDKLKTSLPVDGLLLSLHGAATVESLGDPEGDILARAREIVGPHVPIVASLDLHAHVTPLMVRSADALVAFETYPHRDAYETGARAARLLVDTILGKIRPTMAMAKVPVIVSAINGSTDGAGPFAEVMRYAKSHEGHNGVVSVSTFLVHPYLDLPQMGGGAVVVTNGNAQLAADLASDIASMYWRKRHELEPVTHLPEEAIRLGMQVNDGPVLLVETADCCGGGAAGDSIHTLRALLDTAADLSAIVPVVDPQAATACHAAGVGATITLELGHRIDPQWGKPLTARGQVTRLEIGTFAYTGGPWSGMEKSMGPSAVITIGKIQVMISSIATYDWAGEQCRAMGIDASQAKFIVVKNPMNYRLAYGPIAKSTFILDTPGPTPATLKRVRFRRLERPYFPADDEIPNLQPTILRRMP